MMKRLGTFVAGVVTGMGLITATAMGAGLFGGVDTVAANGIFATSGMRFAEAGPTASQRAPTLYEAAAPAIGVNHVISVLPPDPIIPPDPISPPDPCFRVTLLGSPSLVNPPDPDRIQLQVLQPDALTLLGPDGSPAHLCSGVIDVPPGG